MLGPTTDAPEYRQADLASAIQRRRSRQRVSVVSGGAGLSRMKCSPRVLLPPLLCGAARFIARWPYSARERHEAARFETTCPVGGGELVGVEVEGPTTVEAPTRVWWAVSPS